MTDYIHTLKHLYGRRGGKFSLGLKRIERLLESLGNPQQHIHCVVVAGTNGKGSTSTLLADYLQRCGLRVGLYTSPHLLRFTERIRIDGQALDAERAVELYARVCTADDMRLDSADASSYFECVTAMALMAFTEASVDIAVLEVGLGGRLDATNIVKKVLSVITPISLDHQHLLGDNVEAIAQEKAGIIDERGRVVFAPQTAEVQAVLNRITEERSATAYYTTTPILHAKGSLVIDDGLSIAPGTMHLPPYQYVNIATAWMAAQALAQPNHESQRGAEPDREGTEEQAQEHAIPCQAKAFLSAVAAFSWPGRYQWLHPPDSPPLLLDAAHNLAGGQALREALHADPRIVSKSLHLVVSGLRNKPTADIVAMLQPFVHTTYICPLASMVDRGRSAPELLEIEQAADEAEVYPDVATALHTAQARARHSEGIVLVTGSIFLITEVLALVTPGPRDPPIAA